MSDQKKPYAFVIGQVQAFTKDGVKQPAAKIGDANGQQVYNFTVKTANQNLVDVALWSEYAAVAPQIQEGFVLFADGPVSQREYQGRIYSKIDAFRLAVIPCVTRAERPVANQLQAEPVAAAAAPATEAAPAAAAAGAFNF